MAKTRRNYSGGSISTTTSSSISSSGTSTFTIASYTGWPSGSAPFFVVVEPGTASEEKILVTRAGATDSTLSVYGTPNVGANRGLDGTVAVAHSPGSVIYPVFTAIDADEANEMAATLTTKGDLLTHGSSTFVRVGVGSNTHVLVADSAQSAGIKWGQVQTSGIADDAVTNAKLAPDAVGEAEILNGAVTAAKLGANAAVPAGSVTGFAGSSIPTGWLLCDGSAVSRSTYSALFAVLGTSFGAGDGNTTFNLPNLKGRVIAGFDASQAEFDVLGETGGAKTHTLTTDQMPQHNHATPNHAHNVASHFHSMAHAHSISHTHSHSHEHLTSNKVVNVGSGSAATAIAVFDSSGSGASSALSGTRDTDPINTGGPTVSNSGDSTSANTGGNGSTTDTSGGGTSGNAGGNGAHNNLQPYLVMNYIIKA